VIGPASGGETCVEVGLRTCNGLRSFIQPNVLFKNRNSFGSPVRQKFCMSRVTMPVLARPLVERQARQEDIGSLGVL
jgi:hypothetical protein